MQNKIINDIKRNMDVLRSCPICRNKNNQIIKYKNMDLIIKNIDIKECGNCKIIYSSMMTKKEKISNLYSNEMTHLLKKNKTVAGVPVEKHKILNFRNFRLKQIIRSWENKKFISKKNQILDYGCGDGLLVFALIEKGYEAIGADFNKRKKNENIIDYTELIKKNKKFDIIILRHVLEHTRDPNNFMKSISKFLKKDGRFIVEVPNGNYYAFKIFGKYYEHAVPLFHLYFFTNKNIGNVLKNFKIVASCYNTTGWLAPSLFRALSMNLQIFGLISAIGTILTLTADSLRKEKDSLVFLIEKIT